MKVNGQLEVAQLEQIASTSPTPTPTGRMYIDVTSPSNAVPRIFNGSAWRAIQLAQTTATISQNSGQAVTVDWSQGLFQQVILTNNCVISFANPQSGQVHTLVISQNTTTTVYRYTLNMIDQDSRRQPYQPQGVIPYNNTAIYEWFYQASIKAAITSMPTTNTAPLTAPPTLITGMDISPDGKTLTFGRTSTPYNATYDVTDNWAAAVAPLGLQNIITPATLAGQAVGVVYGLDGKTVFTVGATTPYLQGWLTNRGSSVTVLSNPGTIPTGAGQCINIHPTGYFVGVGHATTPFMSIYPLLGGSYGTKLTNPSTLPAAAVTGLAWSPQGDYLTAVSQTSPFVQTWVFTEAASTGTIGAVSANPGTLPTGGPAGSLGRAVAWRPQGDYIAMANTTTPYLYVVPFNRATGAYGAALTVTNIPAGSTTCVAWSPDGQYLLVGCGTTPFLYIYDFSSFLLNTNVALTTSPGFQVNEIVVHPNGETVFFGQNSTTFITSFQMPTKTRNYLRLIGP
jgi:hypothetical protein